MKKVIIAFTVLATIASCKTSKTNTSLPQKKITETTVEDFATIIGLQRDDLNAKAEALFGTPSTSTKNENDLFSFYTNYYNAANGEKLFSYTYDKKTMAINHIRIEGTKNNNFETTKAFFKERKIQDVKLDFLGMHKDEIIKIMGTPDRVNAGNYEYVKGHVSITFICYDFQENKCSQLYIFWNYYKR
jgi:outer membrane protein assembly factor BamE (lipoprotein component of BamABCDE complex)